MNPLVFNELLCFMRTDVAHAVVVVSMRVWMHIERKLCKTNELGISKNWVTFEKAWSSNNSLVLQFWYELNQDNGVTCLAAEFAAYSYRAFRSASACAYINALVFLARLFSKQQLRLAFYANGCRAFHLAAKNGHKACLEFFARHFTQPQLERAFISHNYAAFCDASKYGHVACLEWFACHCGREYMHAAFRDSQYFAFRWACAYGNVACLEFFVRQFGQEQLDLAFNVGNYMAFNMLHSLSETDLVNCLEFLIRQFSRQQLEAAFRSNDYFLFHWAARKQLVAILMVFERYFSKEQLQEARDAHERSVSVFDNITSRC